jgi:hypothetical protein
MTAATLIGGEMPFEHDEGMHTCLTDSGRSSLRLILGSGFARRRFLLPDFLCGVISRVFEELGVPHAYYRTMPDLTIDVESVRGRDFEVLYVIDYFGVRQAYRDLVGRDQWVVEDAVFLPVVEHPAAPGNWIGFNSYRKISPLADGSLVRSTAPLAAGLVAQSEAPFAALKYRAKRMKAEYLRDGRHGEDEYLALFAEAEKMADRQSGISSISGASLFNLLAFHRRLPEEYRARARNFELLRARLGGLGLPLQPEYPCLFVLDADRRDALRKSLGEQRIFLPVHWPNPGGLDNRLYERVISIPVDSRYGEADMQRVAEAIERFYQR